MSPIFAVGDGKRKQVAQRKDGVWFERFKRIGKPGWSRWRISATQHRPISAWYDPYAGKARLPK